MGTPINSPCDVFTDFLGKYFFYFQPRVHGYDSLDSFSFISMSSLDSGIIDVYSPKYAYATEGIFAEFDFTTPIFKEFTNEFSFDRSNPAIWLSLEIHSLFEMQYGTIVSSDVIFSIKINGDAHNVSRQIIDLGLRW